MPAAERRSACEFAFKRDPVGELPEVASAARNVEQGAYGICAIAGLKQTADHLSGRNIFRIVDVVG
jgi:hypothetical protein